MKLFFVGGSKKAVYTFRSLLSRDDCTVVKAVFCRGHEDEHQFCNELKLIAEDNSINFTVSERITEAIISESSKLTPDAIIGGGTWRSYIPESFFGTSALGFFGLHGSQLPSYRGWAGLNWYIINGEKEYTMRMLQLNEKLDAGPLVARKNGDFLDYSIDLNNEKHLSELLEEVYSLYPRAYNDLVDLLISGRYDLVPQNESEATYTCNRNQYDSEINWGLTTDEVFNLIRAVSPPCPGAYTYFKGRKVIITQAKPKPGFSNYVGRIAGKVVFRDNVKKTVVVLTKDSGVEILKIELPDQEKITPYDFFDTVRDRCKNRTEAYLDHIGFR